MAIDKGKILSGNIRALSKAITLTESSLKSHQNEANKLIEDLLPHTGKSRRIGISGTPGVGKSSFIERLGLFLVNKGHKVAVLAIDPSSPVSGGSILGDKTRMEQLANHPNSYIRPTPSAGTLGGVAQKSREAMLLCEAAGYDIILIETVGVGQSEFEVKNFVDFFTVVLLPGGGDELQGIKKGIIEIADTILINKADGENINNATRTQLEYQSALNLISAHSDWQPKVQCISALENKGIDTYWDLSDSFFDSEKSELLISKKRIQQNKMWMKKLFFELINKEIRDNSQLNNLWGKANQDIEKNESTPINKAQELFDRFLTSYTSK